jgi:hypothetical protein
MTTQELIAKAAGIIGAGLLVVSNLNRLEQELECVNKDIILNRDEEKESIRTMSLLAESITALHEKGMNTVAHEAMRSELRETQKELSQHHSIMIKKAIRLTEDIKAVRAGKIVTSESVVPDVCGAEVESARPVYESNGFTNSPKVVK